MEARTFRSLQLVYSLDVTDPDFRVELYNLLDATRTAETPLVHFVLASHGHEEFTVCVGDEPVLTTRLASFAISHLLWEINRRAVECSRGDRLLLHAAAAQCDDGAVLLAGTSGVGKSTLVAALVVAGFGYLTDDVVPLDAPEGRADAYPKPISLDRSALSLFPVLQPNLLHSRVVGDEFFVTAAMLGGIVAEGAVPRLVIFPSYVPHARCEAVAMSRAEAAVRLAENAFNFSELGTNALALLAGRQKVCLLSRRVFGTRSRRRLHLGPVRRVVVIR